MLVSDVEEMKKHQKNDYGRCHKCGGKMVPGTAIVNSVISCSPWRSLNYDATSYYGGPGRIIKVLKCEECGRSEAI